MFDSRGMRRRWVAKASKLVVLAGGLAGLIGFFLPFIAANGDGDAIRASAFELVRGIDRTQESLEEVARLETLTHDGAPQLDPSHESFEDMLEGVRAFLLLMFAPALLLLAAGGIGVLQGSFGRGLGAFAFLLGAVTLGLWALLRAAAAEADVDATLGAGAQLLVVTGLGGVVGGITALFCPDHAEP